MLALTGDGFTPDEAHVVGIDYSQGGIHLAFLPLVGEACERWLLRTVQLPREPRPGRQGFQAARHVRPLLSVVPELVGPELVYIEHGYGPSRQQDWELGRIQGAIITSLPSACVVEEIHVGTWKRIVCGDGNAKKAQVLAWAESVLPELDHDLPFVPDWADALGIAWAGRAINSGLVRE